MAYNSDIFFFFFLACNLYAVISTCYGHHCRFMAYKNSILVSRWARMCACYFYVVDFSYWRNTLKHLLIQLFLYIGLYMYLCHIYLMKSIISELDFQMAKSIWIMTRATSVLRNRQICCKCGLMSVTYVLY
jgi:hypothetical protein